MCDFSPWKRLGPSWEEARSEYISFLKKKYPNRIIEKYVDDFMSQEYDKNDKDPKIIFRINDKAKTYFETFGRTRSGKYRLLYRTDPEKNDHKNYNLRK